MTLALPSVFPAASSDLMSKDRVNGLGFNVLTLAFPDPFVRSVVKGLRH